jgi:hypothetical protein
MQNKRRLHGANPGPQPLQPTVPYGGSVMIVRRQHSRDVVVTGSTIMCRPDPAARGVVYTIVLDAPLSDGRCMLDARDKNLVHLVSRFPSHWASHTNRDLPTKEL